MNAEPHFLAEYEEGRGLLDEVREKDGLTLAKFRTFSLLLPPELGPQLGELVGRKVGILHLDGYRIKEVA